MKGVVFAEDDSKHPQFIGMAETPCPEVSDHLLAASECSHWLEIWKHPIFIETIPTQLN